MPTLPKKPAFLFLNVLIDFQTYIPKTVYVPQLRSLVFSVNRNTLTWLAEFGYASIEMLLKL